MLEVEVVKSWLEVLAYGLGSLWFGFGILSGRMNHDVALDLEAERGPWGGEGLATLRITVKKGPVGRLRVAGVRVSTDVTRPGAACIHASQPAADLDRVTKEVDLTREHPAGITARGICLVPGDAVTWGTSAVVPADAAVRWTVVVEFDRMLGPFVMPVRRRPQWAASCVSPPREGAASSISSAGQARTGQATDAAPRPPVDAS